MRSIGCHAEQHAMPTSACETHSLTTAGSMADAIAGERCILPPRLKPSASPAKLLIVSAMLLFAAVLFGTLLNPAGWAPQVASADLATPDVRHNGDQLQGWTERRHFILPRPSVIERNPARMARTATDASFFAADNTAVLTKPAAPLADQFPLPGGRNFFLYAPFRHSRPPPRSLQG